jgi:hypothetical protein
VPNAELLRRRLRNHRLVGSPFRSAADAVGWFGAVQSQDYAGAKWAISLRANNLSEAAVDRAFDRGDILRTHILRPTWHFVRREDFKWLVGLSGPRLNTCNGSLYRRMGLDSKLFARARKVFERSLGNGAHLTRTELAAALGKSGLASTGLRLALVVMQAELSGLICSGPRRGKHFTYALVDARVPDTAAKARDEALAELVRRYFTSHGPATIRDFVWWSGLTVADAKRGLEINAGDLVHAPFDGLTCWFATGRPPRISEEPIVRLLANYDEYFVAYRDRTMFNIPRPDVRVPRSESVFAHQVAINGQLCGPWSRILRASRVEIRVRPTRALSRAERAALGEAVERYGRFLQLKAVLSIC